MRSWVAEIDQDAIAEVPGHMSLEALDHCGDAGLVGVHDVAQVLRMEAGGDCGRRNQTAEQERKLPPFWIDATYRRPPSGGACYGMAGALQRHSQIGDRLEQPLTVAKRHPELLQVLVAELRQDVEADVVFFERPRVLTQTLPFQPLGDPDLVRCAPCGHHATESIQILSICSSFAPFPM